MDGAKTFAEILELLGFPKNFKPYNGNYSKEAVIYFYSLFCKNQKESLSFVEALDAYTQSTHGRGIVYLLSESGRIEEVLGLEGRIKRPYLEWRTQLPQKFKGVLERTIHKHYQESLQDDHARVLIEQSRDLFYNRLIHTKNIKERELFPGEKIPAGHSIFGKHFSEFEQDAEMELANCIYLMFKRETYNYKNPILDEKSRLKILIELQQKGYLTDEQSQTIDEIRKEELI